MNKQRRDHIILGIDPGTAITGWAVLRFSQKDGSSLISCGVIRTLATSSSDERLAILYSDTDEIVKKYTPDVFVIEKLFFFKNAKTVISVGEARGVLLLAARHNNVPIVEYTPLQIKQSVSGYGRATKKQIQFMIAKLLDLEEPPKPDDAADAVAAAYTHTAIGFGTINSKSI